MMLPKKLNYASGASAQGGPGISKSITPYVGTQFINMTPAQYTSLSAATGLQLGAVWYEEGQQSAGAGIAYLVVKATATLALGQVLALSAPTTGTWTAAGSTTAVGNTNVTTVTANDDVNNWLYVNATGATLPQMRRIKANTAGINATFTVAQPDRLLPGSPIDKDVFDTLPTNADPLTIIRPFNRRVCTAALVPTGISLGVVTSGNYTIVQVAGLASVLADGSGVALVAGVPAIPGAAGVITGFAGTATALVGTAAGQFQAGAVIIPHFATAAAGLIIPCNVNFLGLL